MKFTDLSNASPHRDSFRASAQELVRFLPILKWLRSYTSQELLGDVFAGVITAILLVPQAMAYALIAGLPPEMGLYASVLPPVVYALLGTSRTMSVGPVAVAAIMVATALSSQMLVGHGTVVENAMILAIESGLLLLLMAVLDLGKMVNFISHPVLTGFTSGAAMMIIVSQLPSFVGVKQLNCPLDSHLGICLHNQLNNINHITLSIGIASLIGLQIMGKPFTMLLRKMGLPNTLATAVSRSGPLLIVILATFFVTNYQLDLQHHVATIGKIPEGMPPVNLDFLHHDSWQLLFPSACFISLIGYVESIAIAKYTANLRRERIDANQELLGLGLANIAAGLTSSMPVAGGFSRTMVNYAAGAKTQVSAIVTAGLIALALTFCAPLFAQIPKATLAAIILVAIIPLVKFKSVIKNWRYQRSEGLAELMTLLGVLIFGIEGGIALGIALSLLSYLWRTSRPHIAVVGRVPNTEHYRNIARHPAQTWPDLLLIRVDEDLNFANIGYIENYLMQELVQRPKVQHLVLICSAVSQIDSTALEALETLAEGLRNVGLTLHLAEVKGPVMDDLQKTDFEKHIRPGKIYFQTHDAVCELAFTSREG